MSESKQLLSSFELLAGTSELLYHGEASSSMSNCQAQLQLGLLARDETMGRTFATSQLVLVAAELPNEKETVSAVMSCDPALRQAWLTIAAARLQEAGKRRDTGELASAIDQLGVASGRVLKSLANASLEGTSHQELETELFGAAAHQAVVWPKLLRVIGATADLVEGGLGQPAGPLPPVAPLDSQQGWCSGRVLQLPRVDTDDVVDVRFVLSGNCASLSESESRRDDTTSQAVMRWVLYRPWAMLLAQLVFVQEAWSAEQISGQLALELADDQMANPYQPCRVDIVVTTSDGDEIVCGTLGELVRRVLARLGVTLLARPEAVERLDDSLAPVIHLLLENKVWRFDLRSSGSGRAGYVIDDDFSTSCYRTFGSKYFYRGGGVLTRAIRMTCEQWAREKLSESGRSRVGPHPNWLPVGAETQGY